MLVLVYAAETLGAFLPAVKRSTMYHWRQFDFALHHVPFFLVVGPTLYLEEVSDPPLNHKALPSSSHSPWPAHKM